MCSPGWCPHPSLLTDSCTDLKDSGHPGDCAGKTGYPGSAKTMHNLNGTCHKQQVRLAQLTAFTQADHQSASLWTKGDSLRDSLRDQPTGRELAQPGQAGRRQVR